VFPEADERSDIEEVRKLEAGEDYPSEAESTDLSGFGEEDKL